jgi:hypothetical protein
VSAVETPGLLAPLSETRIGLFDSSATTPTEVLGFVSGSSHRASIVSWCEVTTDLDLYTQPDPIGLRGGLNLFGYVAGNPLTASDPDGLTLMRCTRPLKPRLIGSSDPKSFFQHVFMYSTTQQRGCGSAASNPVLGFLSWPFRFVTSGKIEADDPYLPGGALKPGYNCSPFSNDPAIEECAMRACDGPAPSYGVCKGPACFDWPEQVVQGCKCPPSDKPGPVTPKPSRPGFNTYPMTVPWGI